MVENPTELVLAGEGSTTDILHVLDTVRPRALYNLTGNSWVVNAWARRNNARLIAGRGPSHAQRMVNATAGRPVVVLLGNSSERELEYQARKNGCRIIRYDKTWSIIAAGRHSEANTPSSRI